MSGWIPLADAPLLRRGTRRARLLRIALTSAALLLAVAAVALASVDRAPEAASAAPGGRTTEIVLDVSGSVGESSSFAAGRALSRLGRGSGRVGLVIFSDSAEKALPPGTSAAQLLPFARAFTPAATHSSAGSAFSGFEANPWHPSFSGGTTISAGLRTAREALERSGGAGTVLLISDLGDALPDFKVVRRELVALARARIPLRILVLPGAETSDVRWFRRLEGAGSFVRVPRPVSPRPRAASSSAFGFPIALGGIGVLLAMLLAVDELAGRSLRWGRSA